MSEIKIYNHINICPIYNWDMLINTISVNPNLALAYLIHKKKLIKNKYIGIEPVTDDALLLKLYETALEMSRYQHYEVFGLEKDKIEIMQIEYVINGYNEHIENLKKVIPILPKKQQAEFNQQRREYQNEVNDLQERLDMLKPKIQNESEKRVTLMEQAFTIERILEMNYKIDIYQCTVAEWQMLNKKAKQRGEEIARLNEKYKTK